MKIAILSNDHMSYIRPMAEGLARMFADQGDDARVLYDGWTYLNRHRTGSRRTRAFIRKSKRRIANAMLGTRHMIPRPPAMIEAELRSSDLVIVVAHLPGAYMKSMHFGIEACREWLGVPIVLYDLVHPTTQGPWISNLLDQYLGGGFGLERYDWYLTASLVSEYPLLQDFNAWSCVGLNLRDSSLRPDKSEGFLAVLDFPRPGFEHERDIQEGALRDLGIPYMALGKRMTIDEIRAIYRKTCLFNLSFRESFGLPIVEVQLCGGYIVTPYRTWAPSHYVGKDPCEAGVGELPENFIVYDNDKKRLKDQLARIREAYDPDAVLRDLERAHPYLYAGDRAALGHFTDLVRSGEITHRSHERYGVFNSRITTAAPHR